MAPYSVARLTKLPAEEASPINSKNHHPEKQDASHIQLKQNDYRTLFGVFDDELKWTNVIGLIIIHCIFVWGLFAFDYIGDFPLIIYTLLIGNLTGLGVTIGAHRLWCHRTYKAKLPLRIFLMLCFSMAGQNSLRAWVRDHRVHHKYTDTEADPHNCKRGFFFAHMGWLMLKKRPEVLRRGREVDMSDMDADPVVRFHQKHFNLLKIIFFVIPSIIPPLTWGQGWTWSILVWSIGRYIFILHFTWSVNSVAHIWGTRPYDKNILPTENKGVSFFTNGEGYHNYHHTFPWDYKAAEFGYETFNWNTYWIDFFAKIGLAYDLRQPSKALVKRIIAKKSDGSQPIWKEVEATESTEEETLKED